MKLKKIKGIIVALLLAIGVVVYLDACKKELVTPINNTSWHSGGSSAYTEEAKRVVNKIKKFRTQLENKEDVLRSGLMMPLDSVIWNVEALFNAEYACADIKYAETVKQELIFNVEVNENDEASFDVVAELYDMITESVRDAYSNDGINYDKSLLAVILDRGDNIGDRVEIKVLVISGRMDSKVSIKDPVSGPFGPDDCWYYGEYGGSCEDPSILCDAAEIIEDTLNYYYSYTTVPASGLRSLNYGLFRISLEGNEYVDANGEPYLYFKDAYDDPPIYLDQDLLNYYYNRELEVIKNIIPSDPRYAAYMPCAFVNIDIQGLLGYVSNGLYMHHKNYLVYGNKAFIPDTVIIMRDLLH